MGEISKFFPDDYQEKMEIFTPELYGHGNFTKDQASLTLAENSMIPTFSYYDCFYETQESC